MSLSQTVAVILSSALLNLCVGLVPGGGSTAHAEDATHPQITDLLTEKQAELGIVGYSAVVLHNGERIHASAAGFANLEHGVPASEDTVFQVFSVAKLFVNVTVMQLVESGQVDLDAPIASYVSDLPSAWRSISVRALLAHSSGLPDYYQWPNRTPPSADAALESVRGQPFAFETGTQTQYNQTNYLLLKLLIEAVTGEDFTQVMRARMIAPANLDDTQYAGEFAVVPGRATMYRATPDGVRRNIFIDQPDYMFASTGLNATASDLATWFEALLDGHFVSEATLAAMWTPVDLNDGQVAGFAQGWEYYDAGRVTVWGHGGGNRADIRHFIAEDQRVTVILLTNGSRVDHWPGSVSYDMARLLLDSPQGAEAD